MSQMRGSSGTFAQGTSRRSLAAYKELRTLNLLGCYNVTDEGVIVLARAVDTLEEVNLTGTEVNFASARELVNDCPNIRTISVLGCKRISDPDEVQNFFRMHHINSVAGEDTLRFYLKPHRSTCLPLMFVNVLKVRGYQYIRFSD